MIAAIVVWAASILFEHRVPIPEKLMRIPLHSLTIVATAVFAVVSAGCSSKPDIRADYDRSADFGKYSTYAFMDSAGPNGDGYQDLFTQYMIAAITTEMESRGYTKSNNPDLLVNFNAVIQEKTKVTTSPAPMPMGGYYGYRGGFYDPWGGYGYASQTNVSQYTEGTFNIDLIDAKKKQLVWEAVAVGRITQKKLEKLQETVQRGVPQFFAQYPFVAGNPTPRPIK
jgi:hypothetical protein